MPVRSNWSRSPGKPTGRRGTVSSLAGRGAYFAARSEFIGALRLVAEGLDTEQTTDVHGRALAAALTAMKEAEDFLPGGSRLEADLDLPGIIAAHATPVLKDDAAKVTSLTALKCYFTFAQEQFAAAAGREVAGSMALHALGKLHDALAQKKGSPVVAPESKAMVFYQAALLVVPQELHGGQRPGRAAGPVRQLRRRPGDARTQPLAAPAVDQLAEPGCGVSAIGADGFGRAGRPAGELAPPGRDWRGGRRRRRSANDSVQWVDPQTFAQTSIGALTPPATAQPPANAGPSAAPNRALSAAATHARHAHGAGRISALDHARGAANALGTIGVSKLRSHNYETQCL